MKLSLSTQYLLISGFSLLASVAKSPLGLEAYPFSLLYWVVALGSWLDGLKGGLFAVGLAIALAFESGASPYRCFWFLLEALAIITVLAARYRILQQNIKLLQEGEIKSEFFDKCSHGMKGHLTNIRLSVNSLKRLLPESNAKVEEVLQILNQECDRLTNLVISVLKIQKLELELATVHPELVSLKPWLNSQVESYLPLARHKGLTINCTAIEVDLLTDSKILEEVISELLLNACKYTIDRGQIEVRARLEDQFVLEIRNQSQLLEVEDLENLFQRFYRASGEAEGTGLGLAIVLKQVELLQGTIEVRSHHGWIVFRLTLPL